MLQTVTKRGESFIMDQVKPGLYPVIIYNQIKNNSSIERKLSMKDLINNLSGYAIDIDKDSVRRTVERHIDDLVLYDSSIVVETKSGNEYVPHESKRSDIKEVYYDGEFTKTDLQIISDALIFSKHIKKQDRDRLLKLINETVPGVANTWSTNAIKIADEISASFDSELYRNLEYIDFAIAEKKCIDFDLCSFDVKKNLIAKYHYEGYTPYLFYLDDDIYYLLGMHRGETKYIGEIRDRFQKADIPYRIFRLPIYRLKHISFNDEAEYISIEDTTLNGKGYKDIVDANYFFSSVFSNGKPKDTAELLVDQGGLNILVEKFGTKVISIIPIKNKLSEYKVRISNLTNDEFAQLIMKLYQTLPGGHFKFVSPKEDLEKCINKLQLQLENNDATE